MISFTVGVQKITHAQIPDTVQVIKTTLPERCNLYREEIEKYDWDINIATRVMYAESGCLPTALNNNPQTKDYSVGLFQINLYGDLRNHRPPEKDLLTPEQNIKYAYELYKTNGFSPWTTYRRLVL